MTKHFNWWGGAKYAGYVGVAAADDRKVCWYDETLGDLLPPLDQWKAPMLRQYLGEGPVLRKPRKIGDAPSSALANIISPRAAKELADIWSRHAELYPVHLEDAPGETYFMVVCREQVGWDSLGEGSVCLKHPLELAQHIPAEQRLDGAVVYAIKKWNFINEKVGDRDLFVLPHSDVAYFVSERFVQRVKAAKLKGFRFDAVYLDPDPIIT